MWIPPVQMDRAVQYPAKRSRFDPEDLRDPRKKSQFLLMHQPVGLGDMEQAVDDVFEHRAILAAIAAEIGELRGIGLVAGNVLPRQIVEAGGIARLLGRKIEALPDGVES